MPGIGGFGRFMIPFGSTMGSALNTFNSYGQQQLRDRLAQEQMQLEQQRQMLDQRRFQMEDARQRFDMQRDIDAQRQKIVAAQQLGANFAQIGQMQSDPMKRRGYDAMANAALKGVPDDMLQEIGRAYGIGPADVKQALEEAETAEHMENARYVHGVNVSAGYEPPGGAPGGGGGGLVGGGAGLNLGNPVADTTMPDGAYMKDGHVYIARGGKAYDMGEMH